MNNSKLLKNKWFVPFLVMAVVAVTATAIAIVIGITSGNSIPNAGPDDVFVGGPEAGVYYYDVVDGKVTITLRDGVFTMSGKINKTGKYSVDGSTVTLDFFKDEDGTATATIDGDTLSMTYDNTAMTFLKEIDRTVTFNVNGGSEIPAVTVINGKTLAKPASDPVKENHVFLGWYSDEAYTTPFAFDAVTVKSDITVYARWAEKKVGVADYTVSFDLGYAGATAIEPITTISGMAYGVSTPEREGYTFGGWWISMYEDGTKLTYQYKEDQTFTADTTLFAVWHDNSAEKLSAPAVSVTENMITWSAVSNAVSYKLTVVDPEGNKIINNESIGGTTKAFDFGEKAPGEYQVSVVAVASNQENNSDAANRYFANKALDRVSDFHVENGILIFGEVDNAQKYTITIDCGNKNHVHTNFDNGNSTTYNLANCPMQNGGIRVVVTASGNGYASSTSNVFVYEKNLNKIESVVYNKEDDKFVWDAVPGASSYQVTVTVDGKSYTFDNSMRTTFSASGFTGNISISVVPMADGYNSPASTIANCTKTAPAAPEGVTAMGNKIFWNAVAGATSYEVNIGGQSIIADTNEVDLASTSVVLTQGQSYNVKVKAINAQNESSAYSSEITVGYYAMNPNLTYNKNTVYWPAVIGVNQYQVMVNDEGIKNVYDATSAKVTLTKDGENVIKVRYVYGETFSDWVSINVTAYAVEYDSRSTTNGIVSIEYLAPGDIMTLPSEGFTYDGYDFAAWYNTPKGSHGNGKAYAEGSVFTGNSYTVVYADWSPKTYNVILKTDGFAINNITSGAKEPVTYTKDFTITVPKVSNAGMYFFAGWYTGPSGTGIKITDENGVSVNPYPFTREVTLYPYYSTNALKFTLQEDGTYAVSKGDSIASVTELTIPVTFNEIPITTILESGFSSCSTLVSVKIPDTIKLIGTNAFSGCKNIGGYEIYKAKDGDYEAFYSSQDGVIFRDDFGTMYLEFFPRAKKGSYTIPEFVDKLIPQAFYSASIEKVIIPDTITDLPKQTFYSCASLKTIEFAFGRTNPITFTSSSIYLCDALENLIFPKNLDIEYSTLKSLLDSRYNLKSITVEEGGEHYASIGGILVNGEKDTILYAPKAYAGPVTIPNGITTIGEYAFSGRKNITSITIPVWVTSIETNAFYGCDGVKEIIFKGSRSESLTMGTFAFAYPRGLETLTFEGNGTDALDTGKVTIGDYAFKVTSSASLRTINIGAGVNIASIGKEAFNGNTKLREINIADTASVPVIGEKAFMNCTGLTSVTIPGCVTGIGVEAFSGCESLTAVEFKKEGATSLTISDYAFKNCIKLGSITLPDHLGTFNSSAFEGCDSLKSINVTDTNTSYMNDSNGILYKKSSDGVLSELLFYPKGLAKANNGVINNLPDTLTTIGGSAFSANQYLVKVYLPKSVTAISNSAFANCESLETVIFDAEGTALTIAEKAFINCPSLSDTFELPAYTTSIGDNAFENCEFTKFVIPAKVTTIGKASFRNCKNLVSVTFNCDGTLKIGSAATNSSTGAFSGCSALKSLALPAGTTEIGKYAFYECTALETATLGSSVTKIENYAFGYCYALKSVTIPKTVTTIGNSVFCGKNSQHGSLEEVIFEKGGTAALTIGTGVFQYQDKLVSITLPARTNKIANMPSTTATTLQTLRAVFTGCTALAEVNIDNDGTPKAFASLDGVIYNKDMTLLYFCPFANVGKIVDGQPTYELIIPNTVKTVMTYAMQDLTALKTITFEEFDKSDSKYGTQILSIGNQTKNYSSAKTDSYATIGGKANSVTTVNLPSHLGTVKGAAFALGLSGRLPMVININPDATNIVLENYAFALSGTTSLNIPYIKELGTYAFYGAQNAEYINFKLATTIKKIPDSTFDSCNALKELNLPSHITEYGKRAFALCKALTQFTIPTNITKIGDYVFTNTGITDIVIPKNLSDKNVGIQMFASCPALQTVTFETVDGKSTFTKIPNSMFSGCSALVEINWEALYHITEIGNSSFNKCTLLTGIDFTKFTELTKIGTTTFSYTGLVDVDLSKTKMTELSTSFNNNAELKTLILPPDTTKINGSAFNNLTSIESLTLGLNTDGTTIASFKGLKCKIIIPAGNISLVIDEHGVIYDTAYQTLYHAGGAGNDLTGYTIHPDTLTIANYAFANVTADKIVIPEGVTQIGDYAFYRANVPNIEISASVTSIGKYAFSESALKDIKFAENSQLTYLGSFAFNESDVERVVFPDMLDFTDKEYSHFLDCESIKSVTFGASTTYIPNNIFGRCNALEEIIFQEGVETISYLLTSYISTDSYNKTEQADITNNVKTLVIPSSVKTLMASAFGNFKSLETVTFAKGSKLETIEKYAFSDCYKLKSVEGIPASVVTLGESAFSNCKTLTALDLGNTAITDIDVNTFRNTSALKNFVFPKNLETIGDYAFYSTGIEEFKLTSLITSIGKSAFENAASLKTLTFPADSMISTLGSLEEATYIFKGTVSLETVTIPNSMMVIGNRVFEGSAVKTILLSDPSAPSGIKEIGEYAFANCVNLTEFNYLEYATRIGNGAFLLCSNLTSVNLSNTLDYLGEMAFGACTKLAEAKIPASVTELGGNPYGGIDASKIKVDPANKYFVAETKDGATSLYDSGKTVLYAVYGANGNYVLPDSVTTVMGGALAGNAITSVTLTRYIKEIPNFMFMNCNKLESVTFDGEITSYGNYAFYNTALPTIEIPTTVTEIGDYAFAYCEKINNVKVPAETLSLGNYCFAYCKTLSNVEFAENTSTSYTVIGTHFFYNCPNITEVILPNKFSTTKEQAEYYQGSDYYMKNVISSYAFAGTGIVNAVIPEATTYFFTEGVFANCKNLEKITFLKDPGSISSYGGFNLTWLDGCEKFKSVYIGTFTNNVAYIIQNLYEAGFKSLHVTTITSEDTPAPGQYANFDKVLDPEFCLYFDTNTYEEIANYFSGIARVWDFKMYDKDGNQLFCSEEDGTIAYVKDATGKVIWEAPEENA